MRILSGRIYCIFLLLTLVTFGQGQDLITDRPDFTESASVVPLNRWQIEMGYTFDKGGELEYHTLGEVLVRFCLIKNFEFRVGLNSFGILSTPLGDTSGLEDLYLGGKWTLIPDKVALLGGSTLPTGADDIGTSKPQPDITLALAHDFSKSLSLGINLGMAWSHDEVEYFSEFAGSAALGYSLNDIWGVFFEVFGFFPKDRDETVYADTGATYLINDDLQLDIRFGYQLNAEDTSTFIGIGVVVRI